MRHAQSDDFVQSCEFKRPLSARGQEYAAHMRHWFYAHDYPLQSALVSAAKRTAETYGSLQLKNLQRFFLRTLYLAPAATLLTTLKKGCCILRSDDVA